MEYAIYKMEFYTGIHIGNTSLEDSEITIHADTLFSALCSQAILSGGQELLDKFCGMVKQGKLLISDAFPYDNSHYYISKPMIAMKTTADEGDSVKKKQFKKMKFIPAELVNEYIDGKIDAEAINEAVKKIGKAELRTQAFVKGMEETTPFHVGIYHFSKGNGLYFTAGYEGQDAKYMLDDLMASLEFDGIGGKRSSGLGRFKLFNGKVSDDMQKRLSGQYDTYMAMSVCLPKEAELAKVMQDASYTLLRRGGFVASEKYASEWRRKRDLYVFAAGSAFKARFDGDVYDVSFGGNHPVYRYAKPLMMGVNAQ